MEAIIVKAKNKEAFAFLKKLLGSLKEVSSFEVVDIDEKANKKVLNADTLQALKDVEEGKVFSSKSHDDLMEQLNK